ncbi:hypothetical protein SCI_0450 [Streptococcus constellatus subsp. pharyngis C1050]|nr:hypothetical protein SCRE_0430 [Streptococcus constellatus subsp. pharyngis C232]AGU74047.1 hypothetical protein SCR2_0430 [Streptococcus constellatus subsp. pharyngis C818]AGU79415.1 hypothetical protein SCI_0450 [Streptococcus constellatus subsp. pharyngis C1050]
MFTFRTRQRAAGCSEHCFEGVDKADKVSKRRTPKRANDVLKEQQED